MAASPCAHLSLGMGLQRLGWRAAPPPPPASPLINRAADEPLESEPLVGPPTMDTHGVPYATPLVPDGRREALRLCTQALTWAAHHPSQEVALGLLRNDHLLHVAITAGAHILRTHYAILKRIALGDIRPGDAEVLSRIRTHNVVVAWYVRAFLRVPRALPQDPVLLPLAAPAVSGQFQ